MIVLVRVREVRTERISSTVPPDVVVYVRSCDVDAEGGRGEVRFTRDPLDAAWFPTHDAARLWLRRPSTVRSQGDGSPYVPMDAFVTELVELPETKEAAR